MEHVQAIWERTPEKVRFKLTFWLKYPDLAEMCRRVLQACLAGQHAPGPIGVANKHIQRLGWSWPALETLCRPGRIDLPLLAGPDSWWKHEIREGIRVSLWSQTAARRQDMRGMQARQGIDRIATLALLEKNCLQKRLAFLEECLQETLAYKNNCTY